MNNTFRRIATACLCAALAMGSVTSLASCSKAEPIATLEKHEISVNMYQFMLSRTKGSLARNGYSVTSADFWSTIVDANNTTYEEYFRQTALSNARGYLAALALFEEMDLKLPQSEYDKIDKDIEEFISTAGSKSALNAELSAFGVNVDMLRDIYVMEAKVEYVKTSLYGTNGSKVAAQVRQQYLEDHAVAFRYVLIRSFEYVYEVDPNGDDIYFLPNENNAKVNNVAYDQKNGTVRLDEFGNTVKDKNGDVVYYTAAGAIAYDKEAGVRSRVYDNEGIAVTKKLSSDELKKNKETAEEILASVEKGDYVAFEALLAEYAIDDDDLFDTDEDLGFLFTSGNNGADYLNDIADTLAKAEDGELRNIYTSAYGYNVVMRYPIPSDAATNSKYDEWLGGLTERVVNELFADKCKPYMDKVQVDEEAFASLPSMLEMGTNYYY